MIFGDLEEGIFIREEKHRFLGFGQFDGYSDYFYISSPSKIGNYVNLNNTVIITRNTSNPKNKLKKVLVAYKDKTDYVFLELGMLNRMFYEKIITNWKYPITFFKKEYKVTSNFKADFIINNTVIEIKSILTEADLTFFPNNNARRILKQIDEIHFLLDNNIPVNLILIVLNRKTKDIMLNPKFIKFNTTLFKCIEKGLRIYSMNLFWNPIDYYFTNIFKIDYNLNYHCNNPKKHLVSEFEFEKSFQTTKTIHNYKK